MVHERLCKETGEVLDLRVSGQVRLGNLIMFDKQSDSTWIQETGKSNAGPLKGMSLMELKPEQWTQRIRWDQWKKKHPDSKVLFCDHCEKLGGH